MIWLYVRAGLSITHLCHGQCHGRVLPTLRWGTREKRHSMSVIREVLASGPTAGGETSDLRSAADGLWAEYWQDRSREHRNRLVIFYAPLVTIVAKRFARRSRSAASAGG